MRMLLLQIVVISQNRNMVYIRSLVCIHIPDSLLPSVAKKNSCVFISGRLHCPCHEVDCLAVRFLSSTAQHASRHDPCHLHGTLYCQTCILQCVQESQCRPAGTMPAPGLTCSDACSAHSMACYKERKKTNRHAPVCAFVS